MVEAWALVVAGAVLVALVIIIGIIWLRGDSVVTLRFLFVFALARWALVLVSGRGQAWADTFLLSIGSRELTSGACGPLGNTLRFILFDELVNDLYEAFLIHLVVAGVQNNVDAALVNGTYQVLEFFVELAVLGQVLVESDLAPLCPHDVRLVEVKLDDALGVLLVPLDVMPPKSLLHQTLD